jgi:hypothetical protein
VDEEWDRLKVGFIETAEEGGMWLKKMGGEDTREHPGGQRE